MERSDSTERRRNVVGWKETRKTVCPVSERKEKGKVGAADWVWSITRLSDKSSALKGLWQKVWTTNLRLDANNHKQLTSARVPKQVP